MSRWLDRRSIWQFTLIWWAGTTSATLLGVAIAAVWLGDHGHLATFVLGLIAVPIGSTAVEVWRRQRRDDANTVGEWVSSRRPPPPFR
jgi:hypothetical protein